MTPTPKAAAEQQRILILYIGVLFFGLNLVDADTAGSDDQHHVMCLLSGIANSPITEQALTGSGASAKQISRSLNMSASSIDWQKMFEATSQQRQRARAAKNPERPPARANTRRTSSTPGYNGSKHHFGGNQRNQTKAYHWQLKTKMTIHQTASLS